MQWLNNYYLAILCGIAVTLSLPPFYFLPCFILSISILYFTLNNKVTSKTEAFKIGWWFGFAYFASSLYWFTFPLLVNAAQFAWLIPFAIFGLPALFALYFAFGFVVFYILKTYRAIPHALTFAITFTCIEWIRGHAFTGFPWNIMSYIWSFDNEIMQITSVIGIYGLVFITIAIIAITVDLLMMKRYILAFLPAFIIIGIDYWGGERLNDHPTKYSEDIVLRIVQANIPQTMNVDHQYTADVLKKYIDLSSSPGIENVSYVIWPEGAVSFKVDDNLIKIFQSKIGKNIIFGANRFEDTKVFNSLYAIDYENDIIKIYDKKHLVPFGEYVPWRNILPIEKIVPGIRDADINENGLRNISIPGLPTFAPSICYEAIFPNEIIDRGADNKAEWILNITNDAWFGISTEPYQHFDMSKIRAIEEGLPLVRVTNAGIPAVIDSYGRVINKLALNQEGIMDIKLPKKADKPTIYSVIANYIDWTILVVTIILITYALYKIIVNKNYVRRKF